jgi:hypothetical protein
VATRFFPLHAASTAAESSNDDFRVATRSMCSPLR